MSAARAARFVAWTDGSSLANPGGPGGTGFVVYDRAFSALRFGGRRYVEDPPFAVTNNRMELRAVLEALDGLPAGSTVELISDSKYLIDALTKWIHGWRRRGWKTSEGAPVLNRDLIEALDARNQALRVEYTWVRGHAGDAMNELVDRLANGAARQQGMPERDEVVRALQVALRG